MSRQPTRRRSPPRSRPGSLLRRTSTRKNRSAMGKQYYAAFLDLENKPVTVIGAGHEAEGKVRQLLASSAKVTLIAPDATEQVRRWADEGRLAWIRRNYQPGDLDGAHLAIVGTDDHEVNH